ncbi:flagellar filament capping protein FliD [Candidatus Nitrospira inopinata]|jgi:flagellar hook-associated protein 2|uniref:Flagellar hook-associated protein 2 n=1 Tax=Candidatus Nitrospira inopinata TaxID=1715989 RepID=A0A0S4KVN8_9BACT|nr:flagellar filament capping protein FliD [Candidatus Nitrospira inopinata]CUQ67242.1 putative Flagellar capping protein FliD [Candidatus Nitrospira inopinata]
MATISFGGLGNGVDFGPVIDQLLKVARLPIDRLEEKKAALNSKNTDYATLSTKLASLQSAAEKLRRAVSFDQSSAGVSNETVLTAAASSSATQGTYQIQVTRLAQSHQVVSKAAKAVATMTTDIVSGSSATFTFRVGSGSNQTVTLGATATLEDLRDQINDLGAGVIASIINTGSDTTPAYRLILTSTSTGADNAITIVTDQTDLDLTNGSGTGGTDTLQAAQDAEVVVGSLSTVTLTRSGNVITDAIPGVTLTLKETGTAQVSVVRDVGAVKNNVKALATAYNDVVKFINERTTYDVVTKKGGNFFNEPAVRTVLSQVRGALSATVPGATTYTTVGEIGFKTERDGTITVDEAKLGSALAENYAAVKALFINQSGVTGVAQLMVDAVDRLDDIEFGSVTLRKQGLTNSISDLAEEIAKREDALALYEERLKRQYAALDSLLRQLSSQASFLTARDNAAKQIL